MNLDLVIVNYNSGEALAQCLDHCLSQSTQTLKLNATVIDNASNDQSWQAAASHPQVRLIKNQHNQGYAAACNQAANLTQSELLAFINPDCFIQAEDLSKLAQHLQQQTNGGIISCRINNPDGSLQRANRRRLPTFGRVLATYLKLEKLPLIHGINITDRQPPLQPLTVEACSGAFFIIKRKLFEKIGGFDTDYPLHFEDLDLFKKVNDDGCHITYYPTITATHLKGHSKQNHKLIKSWKKQGLCRYFKKHRPPIETLLIKIITKIL